MIIPQDIFSIRFYEKTHFWGSYRKMRYKIEGVKTDEGKVLKVTTWPGPYNYETTDDALKKSEEFEFSNQGLVQICDYLNELYAKEFDD